MAFDEQFSLRWNEFQTKLSSGFHAMMEQGALLDVTLGAGGQFIQAHKLVLAICSTYFKQLFEINPCKHPIVILKDVELKELQAIIQFMYKGEVSVSQQDLPAFLKTAEMLQISGLTDNSAEKSHPALQQPKMLPPKPTRISSSPRSMPAMKRFRPELPLPVRDPQKPPPLHCAPNIPEKKFRSDPSISTEAPTIQTQPYSEPASLQNSEGRSVDLHSVKTEPAPIEILDESDEHEQLVSDNMYTEEDSNQMDDTKMSPPDAFNESRLIANQMSEPSSSQAVPQGDFHYVSSRKGHLQLVHNDYIFNCKEKSPFKIEWRCSQYALKKCRAKCTTTTLGQLILRNPEHNHLPDISKIREKEFKTMFHNVEDAFTFTLNN